MAKYQLRGKKILFGVTGSIAAVKALDIIKQLQERGADVQVALTKSAEHFVDVTELGRTLKENTLYEYRDFFTHEDHMLHINLARYADLILIAPASANFIAKLANGFADDLLSTMCLASSAKIAIAPAMNQQMWNNQFTQDNIKKLSSHQIEIIGPANGLQACGEYGYGRMEEPTQIVEYVQNLLNNNLPLLGKKVAITAGPTIERIDAVRYISNFSSGKMGYAIASVAAELGAQVILISGPTHLDAPNNVLAKQVETANEMLEEALTCAKEVDIFVGCAAVADYTPEIQHATKLKKQSHSLTLTLKPTIDIIKEVSKQQPRPYLIGMAAETEDLYEYALKKLLDKDLDMIMANNVSEGAVFGSEFNEVILLSKKNHSPQYIQKQSKINIAKILWQHVTKDL